MKQKVAIFLVILLTLGVLYQPKLLTVKADEENDVIVHNDFSTGVEGWQARGSVLTEKADGGVGDSAMIQVSGRTANWNGIQKSMLGTVTAGQEYEYSINVYFEGEEGTSETLKLSAQKTIEGTQGWDTIAETLVQANQWTQLIGTYTLSDLGVASECLVYVEATNPTLEFFVDEFVLRGEATVNPVTSWNYDFETDFGGWGSRTGTEKVELVDTVAHGGNSCAKVWERSQNYHGLSFNAASIMAKDKIYAIEMYVYQESGIDEEIYLTMQKKIEGTDATYTRLATAQTKSGSWTKVNTTYSYTDSGNVEELILYLEAGNVTLEFYLDDVSISTSADQVNPEIQEDLVGIKDMYKDYFSVGVAIPDSVLDNELMKQLVIKHFNSITAENSMKPEAMLDAINRGEVRFNTADRYDQFAQDNDMGLRGHTLVWHSQTPDWFFKEDFADDGDYVSREVMLERMEDYIEAVAGYYKDSSIYAWDVVNEAVDPSQPDGMRRSLWYHIIGPDFVYKAFEFARKHTEGTDIKLYYNDYSVNDISKRSAIINLLTPINEAGLIDGMGIQGHINMTFPSVSLFSETIGLFETMGLEVQVTELDVSVYENDNERMEAPTQELLIRQGYRYKQLFEMFKTHEGITNITIWGLKDDMSWLNTFPVTRNNFPLLFDKNYQAKPAYFGIVDPSQLPSLSLDYPVMAIDEAVDSIPVRMELAQEIPFYHNDKSGSMKVLWSQNKLHIQMMDQEEFLASTDAQTVTMAVAEDEDITIDLKESDLQTFTLTGDLQLDDKLVFSSEVKLLLARRMKITEAKKGQIVVDGTIDAVWSQADSIHVDTYTQNTDGATAVVKTLYSEDALYVLAIVTDDHLSKANANPWEQDSVEIFIDENRNRSDEHQADDVQYRINYMNETSNSKSTIADRFQSATSITNGGYIVEVKIPMQLGAKVAGDMIGFDVQINDDQGSDARDSMSNWYDLTGAGWRSTKAFGTLRFSSNQVIKEEQPAGNGGGSGSNPSTPTDPGTTTDTSVEIKDTTVPVALSLEVVASDIQAWLAGIDSTEVDRSEGFMITSDEIKLTLDQKTIEGIAARFSEDTNLQVDIKELQADAIEELLKDATQLNEELLDQIKNRPVYQFKLSVGDESIREFEGSVNVELPYELQDGEDPNHIVIYYIDENGEIKMMKNCYYDAATKTVRFKTTHFSLYMIDVNAGSLTEEVISEVAFLHARGFVQGRGEGQFFGDTKMTRAEAVQVFMNLSEEVTLTEGGVPLTGQEHVFDDVTSEMWFYEAVLWAREEGLVQGDGKIFRPEDAVTQEELKLMLERFSAIEGIEGGTKTLTRNEVAQLLFEYLFQSLK